MKLNNFHKSIEETPEDVREYVKYSMDILDRLHELLNAKFDGKQKLLADKMGKTEAEVSKMLSGVQNFTLKTLMKLQVAFGEEIIVVRSDEEDSVFEHVRSHGAKR
jgi:antitoxin component HigA of HigAB toxin-antitoxin module